MEREGILILPKFSLYDSKAACSMVSRVETTVVTDKGGAMQVK